MGWKEIALSIFVGIYGFACGRLGYYQGRRFERKWGHLEKEPLEK